MPGTVPICSPSTGIPWSCVSSASLPSLPDPPLLRQMHDFALSHGDLLAQSEAGAARDEPHLGEPS
jgi:hypothetical protein